MAWKQYSELSKADQQHEDARQKMIVCQSQMERALELAKRQDFPTVETDEEYVAKIKELASELVDWVYKKANEQQNQDLFVTGKDGSMIIGEHTDEKVGVGSRAPTLGQLPEPTLQQKKVLDAIQDKTGLNWNNLCAQVLKWAKEVHGQQSYPTKLDSVETFLKWNNIGYQ